MWEEKNENMPSLYFLVNKKYIFWPFNYKKTLIQITFVSKYILPSRFQLCNKKL